MSDKRKKDSENRPGAGFGGVGIAALLLAVCLLCASCTEKAAASVMQLIRTEGTVAVSDDGGENLSLVENMNLYSGYHMGTEEKSYAWINLDSVKLTKMDAKSEIEIRKEGKQLVIAIVSGGFYFHVTEPLEEDETLDIQTSTMTVGIRGTCGWVRMADETHMSVAILEGTVSCTITDPESGETKTEQVSGGERAELTLYPDRGEGKKCDIVKKQLKTEEIPLFVLTELLGDEGLCEKIDEVSGLTLPAEEGPDACVLRGNAVIFDGETEENLAAAQAEYEAALGLDDSSPRAYLGLADIRIRQADYDGAMELLRRGMEKTGNDGEIARKIAEMEKGTIKDSQNKTRRMFFYDGAGGLMWYHDYTYDAMGRRSGIAVYDEAGGQIGAGAYLYDEQGKAVQTWGWDGEEGWLVKEILSYNGAGYVSRRELYPEGGIYPDGGVLSSYYEYAYDDSGNRIRQTNYWPDGSIIGYEETEYDESGHDIGGKQYDSDGNLITYYVNEYGGNGKMTRSTAYDPDGTVQWSQDYEYDADGNRVSVRRTSGGEE